MNGHHSNGNGEDKFEVFEKWLLENGAKFEKLELRDYGKEVRGCHAVEEIDAEEVIIEVPLRCLITVEMGQATDVGKAIMRANIDLDAPKHIFLMLFMLIDRRNPDSFFKPYYDILPPTLSNMPIFWSEEELDYLSGSHMLVQINERKMAIENDYMSICQIAPQFAQICTSHEFAWARMVVCSRNFGMVINGLRTAALVPYADMLNHYRPRESKWQFDDQRQGFTITSLCPMHPGNQVYDSYGLKCNHRFLLNYGFSVENNVEDDGSCPNEVPMLFGLEKDDPLFQTKLSMWNRDLSNFKRRIRLAVADNENFRIAFGLLRISVATKEDIDAYVASRGKNMFRSIRDLANPMSIENEERTLERLMSMCSDYLSRYPTTYDDDCARLSSKDDSELPLYSNARNALIQVRGEKKVLLHYLNFASTGLAHIRCQSDSNFNSMLRQLDVRSHPLVYNYCANEVSKLRNGQKNQY